MPDSPPPEGPHYGRVQSLGLTVMVVAVAVVLAVVTGAIGLGIWAGLKAAGIIH